MRQIWSLGAGRIFFKSGRIVALTCLFAWSASSMTIDETVNVLNAPSCSIRSAIDAVADIVHDEIIVSQATSYKQGTNEWWVVRCQSRVEADGIRTNFTFFVSSQGVRKIVHADPDRGVPTVSWRTVVDSIRRDLGIAEKNITAMGWVYNSRRGKWIVSIADLRRYEFCVSSGKFRLMPEDEVSRIIRKRVSGGSQM